MPLLIFIYSMMRQLISKYEPFWQKVSVKCLNLGWPLKPLGLLFFFKAHLGINLKVNMLWGSVKCLHLVECTRAFHKWQFIIQDWSMSYAKSLFLEICILKWFITSINPFEKIIVFVFPSYGDVTITDEELQMKSCQRVRSVAIGDRTLISSMHARRTFYHYCGGYIVVMFRCMFVSCL